MVFDVSKQKGNKKERLEISGKLIGIRSDSTKCKVYDPEAGKFSWLNLSLVVGKDKDGKDEFFNCTLFDVDLALMPELDKADTLLQGKIHPVVKIRYYVVEKDAEKDGKIVYEEKEEERGGKVYITKVPKKYINHRCNKDDVINGFKILSEGDKSEVIEDTAPVEEEQI